MTEAEYIENVRARFPKCFTASGLAIVEKLAAMENRKMRKAMGLPGDGKMQATGSQVVTAAMRQKLSEAAIRKAQMRMEALLSNLTRAKSVETICEETGWNKMTVRRALNRAQLEGRAVMVSRKPFQIWQRRQEAAE